ncbi:MAG: sigma 54-interacting transcriptional regulator [Candidatus Poribacteria bacterium]|nr:sigma 54-interacting transcriptional regulator [Candidatus Poribacteria bacterium]
MTRTVQWINVSLSNKIECGSSEVVQVLDRPVAIFNVDGELCAIDNACPHQGGPLNEGALEGSIVTCPWHDWQYCVKTGNAIQTPGVRRYAVRIEDEVVQIAVPANDYDGFQHEQQSQGDNSRTASVVHILDRIREARSLDDVFQLIYADLQPVVPHDRLGLALLDESSGRLVQVKTVSNRPIRLDNGYSARVEGTSLEGILQRGEIRVLNDLQAHYERRPSGWTRLILEEGMLSSLTLPLKVQGSPIGVVFFTSEMAHAFTESHVGFLTQIAGQLSILIERGRWIGELAQNEERYRILFETANDAIFVCPSPTEPFVTFNEKLQTLLGYSYKALSQLSFADLLVAREAESVLSLMTELKPGLPPVTFRARFKRRNGDFLPVEIRAVGTERLGSPMIHGFAHDISEVVALQERLDERDSFEQLIGKNAVMRDIYTLIEQVAPMSTTVLIQGESGTGKELVARAIHAQSPRARKPFVAVNCAALSDNLLESELFGHVKGAYTGATAARRGRFELAHGGTIFLDEIGEMSATTQVKLLRVLQEGEFERVGASTPTQVDARVIAATNRDLRAAMRDGVFREDLFYRLNVVPIRLPALRERREDIPLLIDWFLDKYRRRTGKSIVNVSPDAMGRLLDYDYPGNVRELENVIEHAFVRCQEAVIEARHLSPDLLRPDGDMIERALSSANPLAELEKELADRVLRESGGNHQTAAKRLGISRTTLWRKLKDSESG